MDHECRLVAERLGLAEAGAWASSEASVRVRREWVDGLESLEEGRTLEMGTWAEQRTILTSWLLSNDRRVIGA